MSIYNLMDINLIWCAFWPLIVFMVPLMVWGYFAPTPEPDNWPY